MNLMEEAAAMDSFSYELLSRAGDVADARACHSPALEHAVVEPRRRTVPGARSFELPRRVFVAMAAAYAAFVAEMAFAFGDGKGMPLLLGICVVYLLMYLGTPALFGRVPTGVRLPDGGWARLRRRGLETASGPMSVGAVLGQVLVVPACVAGFGLAVAVIVAGL